MSKGKALATACVDHCKSVIPDHYLFTGWVRELMKRAHLRASQNSRSLHTSTERQRAKRGRAQNPLLESPVAVARCASSFLQSN